MIRGKNLVATRRMINDIVDKRKEQFVNNYERYGVVEFHCNRCGKFLGTPSYGLGEGFSNLRSLIIRIPPENGRQRRKEHLFYICQHCLTSFLRFMKEKEQGEGGEEITA